MKKIIPILLILLSSCISLNVPTKQKKAEKKLLKTLTLVEDITNVHPELVDSVKEDIPVIIDITEVSDSTSLAPDSSGIADFFRDKYDPLLQKRDSLIRNLSNDLNSQETLLALYRSLDNTESDLADLRQTITKEVYPDTTITLEVTTPLTINGDTSKIKVTANLSISEKGIKLHLNIPEQKVNTTVENNSPLFNIRRWIPWYGWVLILGGIAFLIYIGTNLVRSRS